MIVDILLIVSYIAAFSLLIVKHSIFSIQGIPRYWIVFGFYLKLLAGFSLTWVYTYHYTDRNTADIYKYFDDGKVMFSAIYENPIDYLKMIFGLANDNPYFDNIYYSKMNHWYRQYSAYYNDNHTIIRFNAALMLLSNGFFAIHTVFMCFISTLGLCGLFLFLQDKEKPLNHLLFLFLFLSPSLLFWGSGVLKEGLVISGLGLLLYHLKIIISDSKTWRNYFWFFAAMVLLAITKYYVLIIAIPGIVSWLIWNSFTRKNPFSIFSIVYLTFGFIFFGIGYTFPNFSPAKDLARKQSDFITLAKGGMYLEVDNKLSIDTIFIPASQYLYIQKNMQGKLNISKVNSIQYFKSGKLTANKTNIYKFENPNCKILLDNGITHSKINIPKLDSDIISYLKAMPLALFNSLFQPLNPKGNPLYWMAFVENLLYLILFFIFCMNMENFISSPTLAFSFFFVISLLILIGLTTPVVGAIVRYKVPALPLLLGLLLSNSAKF